MFWKNFRAFVDVPELCLLLSDPFTELSEPDWAPNREVREVPLSHRGLTLKTSFPASLAAGFWLDLAIGDTHRRLEARRK